MTPLHHQSSNIRTFITFPNNQIFVFADAKLYVCDDHLNGSAIDVSGQQHLILYGNLNLSCVDTGTGTSTGIHNFLKKHMWNTMDIGYRVRVLGTIRVWVRGLKWSTRVTQTSMSSPIRVGRLTLIVCCKVSNKAVFQCVQNGGTKIKDNNESVKYKLVPLFQTKNNSLLDILPRSYVAREEAQEIDLLAYI